MGHIVMRTLFLCFFCYHANGYSQNSEALLLDAPPSYLAVELRKPLAFNITWRPRGDNILVELTQRQDSGSSTKLLSIDGTNFTLFGAWKSWATAVGVVVVKDNDTNTATVDLGRADDGREGRFAITVTNGSLGGASSDVLGIANFQIVTYASPSSIILTSNSVTEIYDEGAVAIFTCSGNAGRPFGVLQLSRSAVNSSKYFTHFDSVDANSVTPELLLKDGTYRLDYSFKVTIRREDDRRYFRCDVISDVPNYSVVQSNAIQVFVNFSGTVMELMDNPFILGQNGTLQMNCKLDGSEQNTQIQGLKNARILRNSTRETGLDSPVVIAITYFGSNPATGDPAVVAERGSVSDVTSREPQVGGALKKFQGVNTAEVSLKWDARGIVCDDMGEYHCQVQYTDQSSQDKEWTTMSVLRPLSYPANLQMSVREPNSIPGFAPSQSRGGENANNPLEFKEGDVVQMECEGSIGNNRNTKIRWYRTRDFQDDVEVTIPYNGLIDEGTVPEEMENCHYQRKSTVDYNVTVFDVQRSGPILFFCQIEYSMQNGQSLTLTSNRRVFIIAGGRGPGGNSGQVASAGGGPDIGVIVGAVVGALVVIVLVVVLLYFLWYRKRSDGESYSSGGRNQNETGMLGFNRDRTKEERGADDPNMVPTTVDYAVPHKDRKAYDNDAMDDNDRSHGRRNDYRDRHRDDRDGYRDKQRDRYDHDDGYRDQGHRGKANYGMENDSDASPSMTPRINHMGVGEDGSVGTGV